MQAHNVLICIRHIHDMIEAETNVTSFSYFLIKKMKECFEIKGFIG